MSDVRPRLETLARRGRRKGFRMGETIFRQGDPGREMYVVLSGTVALRTGGSLLETVEAGGLFGELALVDEETRSASALAVSDCELLSVDEGAFHDLLREDPAFAREVMVVMAGRLRRSTRVLGGS